MKIKQFVYITDPEAFRKGNYGACFAVIGSDHMDKSWINCGEVMLDINVDGQAVVNKATANINMEIGKHSAALNVLEQRKSELLALEAPAAQPVYYPPEESREDIGKRENAILDRQ